MTAYTPPAGNAVGFDFRNPIGGYSVPAGNAVVLNFANPNVYTLNADPGVYSLTGSAIALKIARWLNAFNNLIVNGQFPLNTSSWTAAGVDTTFTSVAGQAALALGPAASGGYAYQAVSVTPGKLYTLSAFLQPNNAYVLSATPGVYALNGTDVTFTHDTHVVNLGGPYTVSGPNHTAAFTVNYAGHLIVNTDGSGTDIGLWCTPDDGSFVATLETKAELVSGTPPTTGVLSSWYDLGDGSGGPSWGYVGNTGGAKACQLTITVRRKSDAFVLSTCTVSFSTLGGP